MSERDPRPHVVIVGGGFGGLYAARALAERPVRVTLLDRRNHHLFQPLLYQVATAALNPSDIATPLRSILRRASNVTVSWPRSSAVDLAGRRLVLDDGEMTYDALVLATGASHSYFGHDDWERARPEPQDPRGRARDPPPRAAGLRGGRAGARTAPSSARCSPSW